MTFKPMLAADVDLAKLKFPVLASPKFDGIRCCVVGNQPVSRSLKPIPNLHVRNWLSRFPNLDGELIVGDPTASDCFQRTTSAIMSRDGRPEFRFYVFDRIGCREEPFYKRVNSLQVLPGIQLVPHVLLNSLEDLEAYEAEHVAAGWEGIMLRDPDGPYKFGRSTVREGYLLKVKRFKDAEAVVIGVEERMHNGNEQTRNALGLAERSSYKDGKRPAGDLGALVVQMPWGGGTVAFNVGTGFTSQQRVDFWACRDTLKGRIIKFKYQETGSKDAPRIPVFLGFRDRMDL